MITVDQWRALPPERRRAVWDGLDQVQRYDLYGLLAATTPGWGLPYPDDYQDPADSPTALHALAVATEAAGLAGDAARVKKAGDTMTGRLHLQGPEPLLIFNPGVASVLLGTRLEGDASKGAVLDSSAANYAPLKIAAGTAPEDAVTVAQLNARIPPYLAQAVPASSWLADGQISAVSFLVGEIGPGQEITCGPVGINPGTYCVCSCQHASTYLIATYDDRGDGTAVIRVRNSTTATTHTNVRVHAIFINLPAALEADDGDDR